MVYRSAFVLVTLLSLGGCSKPTPAPNAYVDAKACSTCHANIASQYALTGMGRSFYRPSASAFPDSKPWFHKASATWFQMVSRDGVWYQRSWQRDEQPGEYRVDAVMGSGNHVRTYLHRTARNTLVELPLAWYAEKGGYWAMNPGFDLPDPPVGRKIGYDCMFCHNSYPGIPAGHEAAGSEPVYSGALPEGIDCQRCHGPGSNHIQAATAKNAKLDAVRQAIVNPARLSAERGLEVCMQCHLETTSAPLPNAIRRFDRGPFSFLPGERLSSFQLAFDHAKGSGREGKFEIVSSVYRLRQSKCFLKGEGKLTCLTCHDPHDIRHGEAGLAGYNAACAKCHATGAPQAVTAHAKSENCVGCHMAKRRAEDVVHAVMTDHLIQRRPEGNLLAERPEPHLPEAAYHGAVLPYGDSDEIYTAVAQVSQLSNLEAGISELQAAVARSKPENPGFYLELGDALQRAGRSAEAVIAYRQALEKKPNSALLLRRLAQPLRSLAKSQEPLDAMQKAVQVDPLSADAWNDLGLLQSDLGDKTAAVESFRKAVSLDAEFADAHNSLGAVLAGLGQLNAAEEEYRTALRLRPAFLGAHANLGYLLANRSQPAEALWHFEHGGSDALNQFNYGVTLARMNKLAEALVHMAASVQADPSNPVAHDVLGGLLEGHGKQAEAVIHYREAIRLRPEFGKAHLDLGAVLARRKDFRGAAAEFRLAAADNDPEVRKTAAAGLAAVGAR